MRSFLHDGKRLIITAPYHENSAAIINGKNGALERGDHNIHSLKNGNIKDDLKIPHGTSPTSSTCSIAGSVNSTLGSTR
jgi:hypothetical protein